MKSLKTFILFLSISAVCEVLFGSKLENNFTQKNSYLFSDDSTIYVTDSIYVDTTSFTDGLDTILLVTSDTIKTDSIPTDSMGRVGANGALFKGDDYSIFKLPTTQSHIGIHFGSVPKTLIDGIYGINVTGMFKQSGLPNDGSSEYAWEWLAYLEPEVLRFPSGAGSKFMHLLHNPDGINGAPGSESTGYGYDIYEIARYFDWTDGEMNNPTTIQIEEDLDPTWIQPRFRDEYIDFREKWEEEQLLPLDGDETTHRYIDDFIELVAQINEIMAFKGKEVKVIVCLNILSEPAGECKAIVNYLRNNGVDVIGVEMGNEVYDLFHCNAMGFKFFKKHTDEDIFNSDNFSGNYWDYINGANYGNGTAAQTGLYNVLSVYMRGHHNYINAFKSDGANYCKVGLVGKTLGEEFAFRREEILGDPCVDVEEDWAVNCCDKGEVWNTDLKSMYDEVLSGTSIKKFNAVIMHTYYEPSNWQDLVISNFDAQLTCTSEDDLWTFDEEDERLAAAFDAVRGYDPEENDGNFKDFLSKTTTDHPHAYKSSFLEMNAIFEFDLTISEGGKELWTTEWSYKDRNDNLLTTYPLDPLADEKLQMGANGFLHGYLLMEWWLKNAKINFDGNFRNNFYSIATVQNYSGGSHDLITISNPTERVYWGMDISPYNIGGGDPDHRNFHVRRTTYFVAELIGEIYRENLRYLPSTYVVLSGNLNLQPTVFIDQDESHLYVYYTNIKDITQNYYLDPDNLVDLFDGSDYVEFGEATYTFIKAEQSYTTSGSNKNTLFNPALNECYDTYEIPYEDHCIKWIQSTYNDPDCSGTYVTNGCLTSPEFSMGYFKIPITPHYPRLESGKDEKQEFTIFPNPSSDFIKISTDQSNLNEVFKIKIVNLQGVEYVETEMLNGENVDVKTLPAGCYHVIITTNKYVSYYEKFIKL